MQEGARFWDLMTDEYCAGFTHAQRLQHKINSYLWADIDDELYMINDGIYWYMIDTPTAVEWGL
jgi:hypothetical protein